MTYSSRQWAAVRIVDSLRMVPPHECVNVFKNLRCNEIMKGNELGVTSVPPTILFSGISWYLPFKMTEMGRRGNTVRCGAAV